MKACDECGDAVKRRTRCVMCHALVCASCFHHIHNVHIWRDGAKVSQVKRVAMLAAKPKRRAKRKAAR